ncbi:hypothetical protein O181_092436 [Austropuccinia psidii MF-1]|uniref:Reverse transcriptase Ty1/copia-type domain-containing protein n=1 Tax=Austropuccinia psidii MF-1 TaxID=1389203 RepID=A0A9Q3IZH6_9BASI|nr:hypothetical protein [Austropuccinia psidii MF-1]
MLGIKISHLSDSITLSQAHYVDSVLELYGMTNCRPTETPMVPHLHLEEAADSERKEFLKLNTNYHSAIGSVSCLSTSTQSDLAYALTYKKRKTEPLEYYSDANWGNYQKTRRLVTGYLVPLKRGLKIWRTCKQPTVSLSLAEAEYRALTDLTKELLWIQQAGEEIGILENLKTTIVDKDNQRCIDTTDRDCNTNGRRMKHIEIQLHFI